jgi:methyl coenzyme M reductase subunit D
MYLQLPKADSGRMEKIEAMLNRVLPQQKSVLSGDFTGKDGLSRDRN